MKIGLKVVVLISVLVLLAPPCQSLGQELPRLADEWSTEAWLGISISDLTKSKSAELKLPDENGVLVNRVEKDSPAEKAGVQPGDVIVQFNGIKILAVRQFTRMVSELLPDRTTNLVVWRNAAQKTFPVTLARRPKSEGIESYSLDMEPLRKSLEQMREGFHGWDEGQGPMTFLFQPSQGRLGIDLDSLTPQLGEYFGVKEGHGALIVSVRKDSLADKAGLKAGDVVISVDSKEVTSPAEVVRLVRAKKEGDLEIKVLRERQPKSFSVRLEKPEIDSHSYRYRKLIGPRNPSVASLII